VPPVSGSAFFNSSFERCSGRKFLLRLEGKEVDESRAAFFINVVKVETRAFEFERELRFT